MVVANKEDKPLFGLPWIQVFKMQLPKGMCTVVQGNLLQRHSKYTLRPVMEVKDKVPADVRKLLNEYRKLFEDQLGKIKGHKAVLHLISDAKPRAVAARRVSFALKKPVEVELRRLEAAGVIERVDPATTAIEWATMTVNVDKGNGMVWICGDFRVTLNPNLIPNQHPMPTFEKLTAKMARGQEFPVIDLKDAYLQMEVTEQCRRYLIIATHVGHFQFKSLPFVVSASPLIFQQYMDELLQGIDNTGTLLDDIIITGLK
ncbi:hypothetical protein J437_LFUL015298 [Ladona fulva]|uniref:Reverse transcriptase domain-containing protein n=1 Tax=Ladona fulva TaxID=123851 RepID=A0A8K0P945_LADFU|nr:hypothetical protein J437_LFUL015298 [Ladona fulva]